ncbi:hypothetical protein [Marinobacter sp. SS21]|uniref:hypothetical protein n=1 Tax=Marinobacter sp. SS21 TaxID=2979460 RepID=UPI00232DF13F|nr:hypothetical protein [Marinobacter sp. SS21]MDC0661406.1 hypothetical protein [Marinobacter sp. SS21]
MTDQALDGIRVNGIGYDIVRANPGLFSPWDYGIEPHSLCSSNWSGYVAGFEVVGKRLCLSSLSVGWSRPRKRPADRELPPDDPLRILGELEPAPLPALNGVTPEPISGSYMLYSDVDMPLDYTGRLVGCKGDPRWPEAGDCLEFVFEAGILMAAVETPWNDLV